MSTASSSSGCQDSESMHSSLTDATRWRSGGEGEVKDVFFITACVFGGIGAATSLLCSVWLIAFALDKLLDAWR